MKLIRFIIQKLQGLRKHKLIRLLNTLPEFSGITLIDVGAAGDIEPRWMQISHFLKYVGFEPNSHSRANTINRIKKCKEYEIHPIAIWSSKGHLPLRLAKKSEVSSYFPANVGFLANFPNASRFSEVSIENIPCDTLDNVNISGPTFLKLDIQGGELEAIFGAKFSLDECLGIELEVEFSELYLGQPLFGEVNQHLTKNGFEFYDFINLCRWERDSFKGVGQLVFGDALFLRTPEWVLLGNPNSHKLSCYLGILALYNRFDIIDYTGARLTSSQKVEFEDFISKARRFRNGFGRINLLTRGLNGLLKIHSPALKFHLLD